MHSDACRRHIEVALAEIEKGRARLAHTKQGLERCVAEADAAVAGVPGEGRWPRRCQQRPPHLALMA